jgi:hypothetical protein
MAAYHVVVTKEKVHVAILVEQARLELMKGGHVIRIAMESNRMKLSWT